MVGYIYKTTNLINGFVYIGQHIHPEFDLKYKGSGTLLREAFKKFGRENFETELITWARTLKQLNELERIYIEAHCYHDNCYNLSRGGGGGAKYVYANLETKLLYIGIKNAAKAAGVSASTFSKWVNVGGTSKGLAELNSKYKNREGLSSRYVWIAHTWARLPISAILRMKNPTFG